MLVILKKNIHFNLIIILLGSSFSGMVAIFSAQNKVSLAQDRVHPINILETNNYSKQQFSKRSIISQELSAKKLNIESRSGQDINNSYTSVNPTKQKSKLKTLTKSDFYLPEQEVTTEPKIKAKNVTQSHSELLSTKTLELIREFEGFRPQAYRDTNGTPVIGYGLSKIAGKKVQMGDRISIHQAEAALQAEVHAMQQQIQSIVEVELNHHQLGALTSFAFNAGFYSLKESTLLRKLNAGDREGAANEFLRWNKAHSGGRLVPMAGLTKRRQAERQLFLSAPTL